MKIASGIVTTLCSGALYTLWHGVRVGVRAVGGSGTCRLLWSWFISAAGAVGVVVALAGMLVSAAAVVRAVKTAAKLGA